MWTKLKSFTKNKNRSLPENSQEPQQFALHNFGLAIQRFSAQKFSEAERFMKLYRDHINYELLSKRDNRGVNQPILSVVIVTYQSNELLLNCLDSLLPLVPDRFEIIVVDNGQNESIERNLMTSDILYVKSPQNLILSEGRNIGVYFAKGAIVAFLDDDARAASTYVSSIIEAFRRYDIVGLRGRVFPKTEDGVAPSVKHYDLGPIPIPSVINVEGNSAFNKNVYMEMNGMNPLLFGHEGLELSYRIGCRYGKYSLIYYPQAVIYHDYTSNRNKLKAKKDRSSLMNRYVTKRFPGVKKFKKEMRKFSRDDKSREIGYALIKRRYNS